MLKTNRAQLHFPPERKSNSKGMLVNLNEHKNIRSDWKFRHIDSIEEDEDGGDFDTIKQRRSIEKRVFNEHYLPTRKNEEPGFSM